MVRPTRLPPKNGTPLPSPALPVASPVHPGVGPEQHGFLARGRELA